MLDFLTTIGDALAAGLSFLLNIVTGLISIVTMIPKAMVILNQSFGYLPATFATIAACTVAICIVYHLIGR